MFDNQTRTQVVGTGYSANLPATLSKGSQRLASHSVEQAAVGALRTEAATVVAWTGLRGVEMLAGQLNAMHERHGDVALYMSKPIVDGYGQRVRSILTGLS